MMRKKSVWFVVVLAFMAVLAVGGRAAFDVTSGPAMDAIGAETEDEGNRRAGRRGFLGVRVGAGDDARAPARASPRVRECALAPVVKGSRHADR